MHRSNNGNGHVGRIEFNHILDGLLKAHLIARSAAVDVGDRD